MVGAIFAEAEPCHEQSCSPGEEETDAPAAELEDVLPDVKAAGDEEKDGKGD